MKKNILLIVILIIAALSIGLVIQFKMPQIISPAKVTTQEGSGTPAIGGAFSLLNTTGKPVTNTDFRGKLMLVYFGFSHCPAICPTDLAIISTVSDELKDHKDEFQPIFITIDPARDTPERLATFMKNFDPHIIALTGTEEQVKQAVAAYKIFSTKVTDPKAEQAYTIDHSAFIYLIDKEGNYITHFPHGENAEKIVAEVRKHL
jgi:protein SCO1